MPYELRVYNPDGTLRATLTPDNPIEAIAWSVRGDGDMGEAVIRGKGLDLRPRDIVAIRAFTNPGSTGTPPLRYLGWVVQSHDPRAPGLVETRLTSGGSRLADVLNTLAVLDAGDVAELARQATEDNPLPPLVKGWPYHTAAMPLQTFQLGNRYPRLETLADTLEALAATVPGFTVETGSSYTYSGRTYNPGDDVPTTRWGLRPSSWDDDAAEIYFERNDAYVQLSETLDQLTIEWSAASSDGVVDRVHVLLFDTPSESTVRVATGTTDPLAIEAAGVEYKHPSSNYHVARRIDLPPLEGLADTTWFGGGTPIGWTNPGNIDDGDPATYASNDGVQLFVSWYKQVADAVAVRVRYSTHIPLTIGFRHSYTHEWIIRGFNLPVTDGDQAEVIVLNPKLADWDDGTNVNEYLGSIVQIGSDNANDDPIAADSIRVYEITPLTVDTELLKRIAAGHIRLPVSTVATVTAPGSLRAAVPRLRLTLADNTLVEGSVEGVEYSITRQLGLQTTYRLNHALPIDQARARALTDARTARITNAAFRARA